MNLLLLVLPLLVAFVLAIVVTAVHRRLPPALASRLIMTTMIVLTAASLPTIWTVAMSYLAHVPALGSSFEWCAETFGSHRHVPGMAGLVALMLSMVGIVLASRHVRAFRRLRFDLAGTVAITDDTVPFAYTMPGRGGQIVLSQGLIDLLDDEERDVVIAHERAHARNRHDRYLLAAQLCSALVPLLRPLVRRLQFTLERWADEAAVRAIGDRRLVATTLGKVALSVSVPLPVPAFNGLGVSGRVAALLQPAPLHPRTTTVAAMWGAIAVVGLFGATQMHHLIWLAATLCRH
jgi:hypothetical protein